MPLLVKLGTKGVAGILGEKENQERLCILLLILTAILFSVYFYFVFCFCLCFIFLLFCFVCFVLLFVCAHSLSPLEKGLTRFEPIVRDMYISKPNDDGIFSPGDDFFVQSITVKNFGSISCPKVYCYFTIFHFFSLCSSFCSKNKKGNETLLPIYPSHHCQRTRILRHLPNNQTNGRKKSGHPLLDEASTPPSPL